MIQPFHFWVYTPKALKAGCCGNICPFICNTSIIHNRQKVNVIQVPINE